MDTYGLHLIADLSECQNIHDFDSESRLASLVRACAIKANANVLFVNTHKFQPQGISATAVLAESHLAVHLYPENNYISFDCFTCGHSTKPWDALNLFIENVKPLYKKVSEIERGLPFLINDTCNVYNHHVNSSKEIKISLTQAEELILQTQES